MFGLDSGELLVILLVALVVVGPKDLPRLMRMVGRWVGKARGMADQFKKSFDEMARDSELDELRTEVEALRRAKPFSDLEADVNSALRSPDFADMDMLPAVEPQPVTAPEADGAETADPAAKAPDPDAGGARETEDVSARAGGEPPAP